LLNHCLRGSSWPEDLLEALVAEALDEDERIAGPATRALLSIVVERLADLFEPRLCDIYAALFARVIQQAMPELKAPDLVRRYRGVREVRAVRMEPRNVFVLSRVTLGADIAVTSIVLDAARRRFPSAQVWFAGPQKAWELFERSRDLRFLPMPYGRSGVLAGRLAIFRDLQAAFAEPDSLVLDPDSRLTQLGLLPVCPEERHYLFESRSYGGDSLLSLPQLTRRWVGETLGIEDAQPWLHPKYNYDFGSQPVRTVSLGVGENPAKRISDDFEAALLGELQGPGRLVMVDEGAPGSEESDRVKRAVDSCGAGAERIGTHHGSFASFAAMIAASELYAGYDSAGQHVAAALGIPLIDIFAGHPNERMFARWRPDSPGPTTIIRVDGDDADEAAILKQVRAAIG